MIFSLFLSKNQKLVKKWEKEHEEIVVLATNIIGEYQKNNPEKAKEYLITLNNVAVNHLMNEDIEFYRLLKDQKRLTRENETLVHEFRTTFKGTKTTLMNFLSKYSKDGMVLDEYFFREFNKLVEVVLGRIKFEEENLYRLLYTKG